MTRIAALQLQDEWEDLVNNHYGALAATFISDNILRPFLFFIPFFLKRPQSIRTRDIDSMKNCFKILSESINCTGMQFFTSTYLLFCCRGTYHLDFQFVRLFFPFLFKIQLMNLVIMSKTAKYFELFLHLTS